MEGHQPDFCIGIDFEDIFEVASDGFRLECANNEVWVNGVERFEDICDDEEKV